MIASIGYEAPTATLEIEFRSGGPVWQYFYFPEHTWNQFEYADSHGKFFHSNLKHPYREARVG